jgi:hypothetical protein
MLDEQIATSDLASGHFAAQLIERIGWALADAESSEHRDLGRAALVAGRGPARSLTAAA